MMYGRKVMLNLFIYHQGGAIYGNTKNQPILENDTTNLFVIMVIQSWMKNVE